MYYEYYILYSRQNKLRQYNMHVVNTPLNNIDKDDSLSVKITQLFQTNGLKLGTNHFYFDEHFKNRFKYVIKLTLCHNLQYPTNDSNAI